LRCLGKPPGNVDDVGLSIAKLSLTKAAPVYKDIVCHFERRPISFKTQLCLLITQMNEPRDVS
jgi:hypothetical protein